MKKHPLGVFSYVLSAGIEPTLPAPQASVLSVERRERCARNPSTKEIYLKILKTPVLYARAALRGVLQVVVLRADTQYLQWRRQEQE